MLGRSSTSARCKCSVASPLSLRFPQQQQQQQEEEEEEGEREDDAAMMQITFRGEMLAELLLR